MRMCEDYVIKVIKIKVMMMMLMMTAVSLVVPGAIPYFEMENPTTTAGSVQ